jgi:hypothetical protein
MNMLFRLKEKWARLDVINSRLQKIQEAIGRIESRQLVSMNGMELAKNEFQVYSQWGEDGIIQHLLRHVVVENKIFVEFGVGNYTEANTRFLLVNDNWSGLVIEGSKTSIEEIRNDPIYWRHNVKSENAFINKDNINELLVKNGVTGDIGILSVDIDGNDYWVWEAIHVISPAIVIVEYNARFGAKRAVTIPYDEKFVRSQGHYSMIYWGASLKAFCMLANCKGYAFVGCNSNGINAFFVRRDLKPQEIRELSPESGYVRNQCRESRDEQGKLNFLSFEQEQKILLSLPLTDLEMK